MEPTRKALVVALALACALRSVSPVHAGPVIIRDSLISDPSITPSLGRGYSIATNTFQSVCMSPIVKTTPSYNFFYNFEELDSKGGGKSDIVVSAQGVTDTPAMVKVQIDNSANTSVTLDGKTAHRHYLKVSIDMETYYATIDEEQSPISPLALALITANDMPGFFDACGVYYTRSINRRSTYLSIFSYETGTPARDQEFEKQLKNEISSFGSTVLEKKPSFLGQVRDALTSVGNSISSSLGGRKAVTARTTPSDGPSPPPPRTEPPPPQTAPPPEGGPPAPSLEQEVKTRKTSIRSYAFGIGKQSLGDGSPDSLVAYDLATFKSAMAFAFKMMQNDNVGVVTSIEVVPWIENTQFQSAYKLPTSGEMDDPNAPPPTAGAPANPVPKIKISPYAQKRIMAQNSEFLSEIDRSSRARLLTLYKAKLCKLEVEKSYGKGGGNGPVNLGEYGTRNIVNHRTKNVADQIPLSTLYTEQLVPAKIDALANDYQDFTYTRAQTCIETLLTTGFTTSIYRNVPACAGLEKDFVVASSRMIDEYCRVVFAPSSDAPASSGGAASGPPPGPSSATPTR